MAQMPPPANLQFYMDESVSGQITEQLGLRGIDVLRAQDFSEGASDEDVLDRAVRLERILVSQDVDHITIGTLYQRTGQMFYGIVFIRKGRISVGQAVDDLEILAHTTSLEEWEFRLEYLPI
jgi:predicted nuclease of predicted toxin-antitoxin system